MSADQALSGSDDLMLSGISITCFAASYAVTLTLEVSRLFFRLRVRWIVMILFAAAGLFAHTAYLAMLTRAELEGTGVTPLSHWYDWCLLAAWVLAALYLIFAIRRPENTVGIFLLPLVLALVGAGYAVREAPPFAREQALSYWGMFHGIMLLLGTVTAALGFAAGIMYLLQSYRLKHKLLPRPGFRLPTLEWLQKLNRRSLLLSTFLLALGLVAGLTLNLIRQSSHRGTIAWTDPVVVSSGGLFLWLATATLFGSLYKPAREGRKVAYITLVSFVFLGLVLGLVLRGQHGISQIPEGDAKLGEVSRQTWPQIRLTDSSVGSGGRG
ncbi:MAG: cytochrome c biogenesis protein CcsA [Pirellulaceae bacterium]